MQGRRLSRAFILECILVSYPPRRPSSCLFFQMSELVFLFVDVFCWPAGTVSGLPVVKFLARGVTRRWGDESVVFSCEEDETTMSSIDWWLYSMQNKAPKKSATLLFIHLQRCLSHSRALSFTPPSEIQPAAAVAPVFPMVRLLDHRTVEGHGHLEVSDW